MLSFTPFVTLFAIRLLLSFHILTSLESHNLPVFQSKLGTKDPKMGIIETYEIRGIKRMNIFFQPLI